MVLITSTPAARLQPVTADKFDRVWASLSSADRIVILGHDRPLLTSADKVRLATVAAGLGKALREGGTPGTRTAVGAVTTARTRR